MSKVNITLHERNMECAEAVCYDCDWYGDKDECDWNEYDHHCPECGSECAVSIEVPHAQNEIDFMIVTIIEMAMKMSRMSNRYIIDVDANNINSLFSVRVYDSEQEDSISSPLYGQFDLDTYTRMDEKRFDYTIMRDYINWLLETANLIEKELENVES